MADDTNQATHKLKSSSSNSRWLATTRQQDLEKENKGEEGCSFQPLRVFKLANREAHKMELCANPITSSIETATWHTKFEKSKKFQSDFGRNFAT